MSLGVIMRCGPVIGVEGIIGSGKTTLAKKLAKALPLRLLLEPVESNPYLKLFYEDPARWAFPMQIELLHRRYALQKLAVYEATCEGGHRGAVLDRTLQGDAVFCKLHAASGNMSTTEWETYSKAVDVMTCSLVPPSILIYLDVEPTTAFDRMRARGREAEGGVPLQYLRDLQRGYQDLLVELDSGKHPWSRSTCVMRVAWNADNQPIEPLVAALRDTYHL